MMATASDGMRSDSARSLVPDMVRTSVNSTALADHK